FKPCRSQDSHLPAPSAGKSELPGEIRTAPTTPRPARASNDSVLSLDTAEHLGFFLHERKGRRIRYVCAFPLHERFRRADASTTRGHWHRQPAADRAARLAARR